MQPLHCSYSRSTRMHGLKTAHIKGSGFYFSFPISVIVLILERDVFFSHTPNEQKPATSDNRKDCKTRAILITGIFQHRTKNYERGLI